MVLDDLKNQLLGYSSNNFSSDFFLGLSLDEKMYNKNNSSGIEINSELDFVETSLESYKKNIILTKELGITNFRFSLSWKYILPEGNGYIDQTKITFYHEVLDFCIANEIEPIVTLFDSNLPEALEKKGGWSNRDILIWFENYVTICVNAFNTKVNYWIVLNQPSIFTGVHFFLDKKSLNEKALNTFLPALHHTLLCQSIGTKTIKKIGPQTQVGTVFSCHYIIPKTDSSKDFKATDRIDTILNRLFLEPSLGLGYPEKIVPCLKKIAKYFESGDSDLLKVDFDFIGLHNYKPLLVAHDLFVPFINARVLKLNRNHIKSNPSEFEFELNTDLIYLIIKKYSKYEGIKKIFIVENNTSYLEETHLFCDHKAIEIIQIKSSLQQILNAKNSGGKVNGYFISSLNGIT